MAFYSVDRARRARFTLPADSITLPQSFNLADPDLTDLSLPASTAGTTSANDSTPTSSTLASTGAGTDGPPGFTPEQQAWIESLVRSATTRSRSPVPATSASGSLPPPPVPRMGNVGK